MNNFINVRIKPYHHHKEKNDIKHNLDTATKKSTTEAFRGWANTEMLDYQDEHPLKILKKWRADHNQKYKARRKENLTNTNSTILNGVISFSEALKRDLGRKYSREEFEQACRRSVELIAKELKTEIMYIAFHYNEKTPHVQWHMKNYDNEGRSVFYKHRNTKELEVLQDLAFSELKSLGMKRGISKIKSGKTHQSTKVYFSKLHAKAKTILRDQVNELKDVKREIKALDLTAQEKRSQMAEIDSEQKTLRRVDKLLGKAKKGEALTVEESNELKEHLPTLADIIPTEKKKAVIEAVEQATNDKDKAPS